MASLFFSLGPVFVGLFIYFGFPVLCAVFGEVNYVPIIYANKDFENEACLCLARSAPASFLGPEVLAKHGGPEQEVPKDLCMLQSASRCCRALPELCRDLQKGIHDQHGPLKQGWWMPLKVLAALGRSLHRG